jgi:hypothetical protein
VNWLIQLVFQLCEATKKTEATEKVTLRCLCFLLLKFFLALDLSILAIMDRYLRKRAGSNRGGEGGCEVPFFHGRLCVQSGLASFIAQRHAAIHTAAAWKLATFKHIQSGPEYGELLPESSRRSQGQSGAYYLTICAGSTCPRNLFPLHYKRGSCRKMALILTYTRNTKTPWHEFQAPKTSRYLLQVH